MSGRTRPFIIGLTGSIGMGKSTVAKMFVEEGVPLFDADAAVHQLQGPDGALVEAIEALFPGTTGREGVDRQKLGAAVLGNPDAMQKLEKLIHPAVGEMRLAFLEENQDRPLILFDIPLLFEKSGAESVDHIVVVSAGEEHQRERVLARPGMTEERFSHIKALQMPDAEKRAKADSVIDTSLPLAETRQQVGKLVQKLKAALA
ncbi:dephospho-CoA kinase [Sphingorhabdus sp. SMR4y]|uniref:dephospho-CoA kinase n=1 Tax=Sphingorhabdus sp. SMR4y TaxID=2584094 RepID=UPI000B5C1EAC|nr:dephospho-CoA kinase [Sphingorhabdus sp. SMR4y]ASK89036.1 dephospho-CoA kinase [Sphingorhabdus sp. SMR4y]